MEPTKVQITEDFAEVCRRHRLPDDKISKIQAAVAAILGTEDESIPLEEVFLACIRAAPFAACAFGRA